MIVQPSCGALFDDTSATRSTYGHSCRELAHFPRAAQYDYAFFVRYGCQLA